MLRISVICLWSILLAIPLLAEPRRIVVERPAAVQPDSIGAPYRYEAATDSTPGRVVIDPGAMIFQMKVDSVNRIAEEKIRDLIKKLERHFEDPQVEEEVGRWIGEAVMQQQMSLLDLQIDRALEMKDTLLLKGLETTLRELIANSDVVRAELRKQLNLLEHRFDQIEGVFEESRR
ncbi:hypothetical protein HZB60_11385 [candidate division KSB1 bacterium]|nr:hypothetical protein [candidate division KSB1 bacterium]